MLPGRPSRNLEVPTLSPALLWLLSEACHCVSSSMERLLMRRLLTISNTLASSLIHADSLVQNIYGRFSTMGVLAQSLYVARMNVDSGKVVKSPWTPTGSDQLSDRAEDLFSLCKDLLSRYDLTSIELATDDAQLHFEGDWDADCRKLQNLLDIGRQATEAQIQGLLSSEESVTKDNAEISTTEVDKNTMAWREATAPDQEKGSGEGWGIVAKKTERGVGRLIKVVSEEL